MLASHTYCRVCVCSLLLLSLALCCTKHEILQVHENQNLLTHRFLREQARQNAPTLGEVHQEDYPSTDTKPPAGSASADGTKAPVPPMPCAYQLGLSDEEDEEEIDMTAETELVELPDAPAQRSGKRAAVTVRTRNSRYKR